jgi:hypothetical protein
MGQVHCMTYRAKMKDGQVVFEGGIKPADGVELRVEEEAKTTAENTDDRKPTASEVLMKFAGIIKDPSVPSDGSFNHDHYIYGAPKRER